MARSAFGRVFRKRPRRGWLVRFRHKGREYERGAGPSKGGANRLLAKAHAGLAEGKDLDLVLSEVFGDRLGPKLSLCDAVPLYIEYKRVRHKATTYGADRGRLEHIKKQPWAKLPLSQVRRKDIQRFADGLLVKKSNTGQPRHDYLGHSAVWANGNFQHCYSVLGTVDIAGGVAAQVDRVRMPVLGDLPLHAIEEASELPLL